MARKEEVRKEEESWRDLTFRIWRPRVDDSIEGFYVESEPVAGTDGNPDFNSHHIALDSGELIAVHGAQLDKPFAKVEQGTRVRVTFLGTEDLDNGRRMHFYRLQVQKKA